MASRYPVPFTSSRELRSFDPLLELHREMDRLFDNVFGSPGTSMGSSLQGGLTAMPRIDMQESEREICIWADLPGVKPSDVDVRVDGDMLTISGETKTESDRQQADFHVMERSRGRFQRRVQLPYAVDPDQVRAECDHGVLTVHLPKQAQQQKSRRIEVRGTSDQAGGTQAGSSSDQGSTTPGTPPETPTTH
jgi:HSP20 family protein